MVSFPILSSGYLVVCSGDVLPAPRVAVAIRWMGLLLNRVLCGLVGVGRSAGMAHGGFFHSTVHAMVARRYLPPLRPLPRPRGFLAGVLRRHFPVPSIVGAVP